MALAWGRDHGRPFGRGGNDYSGPFLPAGHPDSGVICGLARCGLPGQAWLLEHEVAAYAAGERIFPLPTAAAKVRIQ
jgi:hypothetical protein